MIQRKRLKDLLVIDHQIHSKDFKTIVGFIWRRKRHLDVKYNFRKPKIDVVKAHVVSVRQQKAKFAPTISSFFLWQSKFSMFPIPTYFHLIFLITVVVLILIIHEMYLLVDVRKKQQSINQSIFVSKNMKVGLVSCLIVTPSICDSIILHCGKRLSDKHSLFWLCVWTLL